MESRPRARVIAAGVCAVETLVLLGFTVFYLLQLLGGRGEDVARVVTELVLIVLSGLGTGALTRLWWGSSGWPATPTLVWHALLVPVAWAMFQSGQLGIGLGLVVAIILAGGAAFAAGPGPELARPDDSSR